MRVANGFWAVDMLQGLLVRYAENNYLDFEPGAALVPRPRLNLTRFHGVFAPNCKLREHIVPSRQPTA